MLSSGVTYVIIDDSFLSKLETSTNFALFFLNSLEKTNMKLENSIIQSKPA